MNRVASFPGLHYMMYIVIQRSVLIHFLQHNLYAVSAVLSSTRENGDFTGKAKTSDQIGKKGLKNKVKQRNCKQFMEQNTVLKMEKITITG